jgi:hypothetical protein
VSATIVGLLPAALPVANEIASHLATKAS